MQRSVAFHLRRKTSLNLSPRLLSPAFQASHMPWPALFLSKLFRCCKPWHLRILACCVWGKANLVQWCFSYLLLVLIFKIIWLSNGLIHSVSCFVCLSFFFFFLSMTWELSGSPVVMTPCSHCQRPGFNPWSGNNHAISRTVRPKN